MKNLFASQELKPSTRALLLAIWSHLSNRRRIQLGYLLIVMFASAVAELISLGSVLPFLTVLSDPQILWQQKIVQSLAIKAGFTVANHLILPATLAFVTAAIFAGMIRLMSLWLNGRLAAAVGSDLSCEAYLRSLYQPYQVHLSRNSAELIAGTTIYIQDTVSALNAFLLLTTSGLVAVALLLGLMLIDIQVALATSLLFGGSYWILGVVSRRELRSNGLKIAEATSKQLKALQEGLGAVRDVLLDGTQHTYLQIYRQADRPQRQLRAKNNFLSAFPRFAFEALGMVAIALLGGILVLQRGSGAAVIPLLGALALGAQRLLPALQQVYNGWASFKSYDTSIKIVLKMLKQPLPARLGEVERIVLRESISFKNVHFRYNPDQPNVLDALNFEIYRGQRIGFIGGTGSGKSTTVDLLMGLLIPTAGKVFVDGKNLHDPDFPERLLAWRRAIAHVPQSIYLADSSIAENIAFGIPSHQVDLSRVKQAASQAQIADFIDASPKGYQTFVGERGIRLSGGQRQRIGIARALYKQAQVLVFDEATSALDVATEEAVMEAVNSLSSSLTVIMIAHRLSTVQQCDRIIRLENGKVIYDSPPG